MAELRYFAGLTNEETAEVLGVSRRDRRSGAGPSARAWLARHLRRLVSRRALGSRSR